MRSATLSTILLAVAVTACSSDVPTAARVAPSAAVLAVAANNKQRTQSIEDLAAAFEATATAGDAAAYAALFAEDVELITYSGGIVSGRAAYYEYIQWLFSGPFAGTENNVTVRRVQFLTGIIAIVDAEIEVTGFTTLPPGLTPTEPGVVRARVRWVVVRRGGDWQILASQNTPIPPPGTSAECPPSECAVTP